MTSKNKNKIVDHLFRHQFGKMVSILTRIFGFNNLELIEDAIQDTFLKASIKWRERIPENPEAWLTMAAKNRVIDLLRRINSEKERSHKVVHGSIAFEINEYFLEHEVEDSQLRMIFVATHPLLAKEEQIAFALKSISGFSLKEIAAALLQKEETIKKRLSRARKKIISQDIQLNYPSPEEIPDRLSSVLQIIYLIFNEGFHSSKKDNLISKDLCGESLRLCKLLLVKENFRTGSLYALFALLCFHSARLESKILDGVLQDLKHQDRSKWFKPLINLGFDALNKSLEYEDRSIYHIEAAIAVEHVRAQSFEHTNWFQILSLYDKMYEIIPSNNILITKASILLICNELDKAKRILDAIDVKELNQLSYLYYGTYAELYEKSGDYELALSNIELAIKWCSNKYERQYLEEKRKPMQTKSLLQ